MSHIAISQAPDTQTATITLNRPDKRNALTLDMWRDLRDVVATLATADLRCVVVRGAGGNFAAGADLSEFAEHRATSAQAEGYGRTMIEALTGLRDCPHPTIAAIEGLCVGGGLEIALMCDLRLAAPDTRYGIPIQKVGVAMPYPELAILTQMLGRPTLLALLLEGQIHDADWAERHGLVTRIAPDLNADLTATIGRILSGSPVSHRHHKRFTRLAIEAGPAAGTQAIREAILQSYQAVETDDYREGIAAFRARRPPKFNGR